MSSQNLNRCGFLPMRRVFAQASHETFKIKPVGELLRKYNVGKGWADPFAGRNSPAQFTNDHNPEMPTGFHLEAERFGKQLKRRLKGALFDPPYSYRQISEHYRVLGKKATYKDTSYNFYRRAILPLARRIEIGGYAISFGWQSNGFGKCRGFEIIEVLLIAHGLHHQDTIVTVERKVRHGLTGPDLCERFQSRPLRDIAMESAKIARSVSQ